MCPAKSSESRSGRRAVGGHSPKFDVTASTDYCTFLRQRFTRRASDGSVLPDRTRSSACVLARHLRQNCVLRHFREDVISKNRLPSSSHPLALRRQVIGRDDLDRDWTRRLDRQNTALLQDQPHRESRVGAQIVVQHHRDAACAQQSPVVGIEVMGNKDTALLQPRRPWPYCRRRRSTPPRWWGASRAHRTSAARWSHRCRSCR